MDPTQDTFTKRSGQTWALLAIVLGAVAIAFAGIFFKLSSEAGYLGPMAVGFWRVAIALPVFLVIMACMPRREIDLDKGIINPLWLLVPGILFACDLGFWHTAFLYTTVSNGTLLANLQVILVGIASWFIFKERLRPIYLVGVIVAFGGTWILLVNGQEKEYASNPALGDGLSIVTAFWYASYLLFIKWLRRDYRTIEIMTATTVVAAVVLFLAVIIIPQDRDHLLPFYNESMPTEYTKAWIWLILLALVPQCLGQGLIVWALSRLPVSFLAVVLLLQPVFAAFLGWIILSEALSQWQLIASGIVLVGIVLARFGTLSRSKDPSLADA